ncbi:MAG: hypothetical protein ACRD1C_11870 [Terriglobales bacterium]
MSALEVSESEGPEICLQDLSAQAVFGFEWCAPMWASAAKACIACWLHLLDRGLTLWRTKPEDFAFHRGRALLSNPGAVAPMAQAQFESGLRSYTTNFARPMTLIGKGGIRLVRALTRGYGAEISAGDLALVGAEGARPPAIANHDRPPREILEDLLQLVSDTSIPDQESIWSGYYHGDPPLTPGPTWAEKRIAVDRALGVLRPISVVDLASNTGWYARLSASRGAAAIALDRDEACLALMFTRNESEGADLLPVYCDLLDPSPALGFRCVQYPSAQQRFTSDMALALAISHHLILGSGIPIEAAVDAIQPWAKRWLLTEFVPLEKEANNPYFDSAPAAARENYTFERYLNALGRHFSQIVPIPGPPRGRHLVLCER